MVLLLAKFLWPLFKFNVPLGYDPGIYRFLFLEYAESLRTFSMPDLLPWAKEYPPALFLFFAPLIQLGLPVDAIIGWIWNLVPVATLLLLAWVIAARSNAKVGVAVLVIGLLSQSYFDGFFAMYWKTYAALFLVVLTYHLAEQMSPWFLLTALATVMTHQQTGLVLSIALGVWWLREMLRQRNNHHYRVLSAFLVLVALIATVWYLPQWERAIWSPLKSIFLLRGDLAPPGSFPGATFYLQTMGILLLLGLYGFIKTLRKEKGSLWQISVVVCLIFIVFRLVFYKRFFLQLDFFLMPFAAYGLVRLLQKPDIIVRASVTILLVAQTIVSFNTMLLRKPRFARAGIIQIEQLASVLPEDATIISLENVSSTWLRGWLPAFRVGGPGLFDLPGWTYKEWEKFVDGEDADRKALLAGLDGPAYFFVSTSFTRFYGERANGILNDPCLKPVQDAPLLFSTCSKE